MIDRLITSNSWLPNEGKYRLTAEALPSDDQRVLPIDSMFDKCQWEQLVIYRSI